MSKTAQIFTILMIALLLASMVTAEPFMVIKSSKNTEATKTAPAEDGLAAVEYIAGAEPAADAEPAEETEPAEHAHTKAEVVIANPSFTVIRQKDDMHVWEPEPDEDAPEDDQDSNSGFGVNREALTVHDIWWWGLNPSSTELHIDNKEVVGNTIAGESFVISITATDSDDLVTRISMGESPYLPEDYDIRDCDPAANECTIEFELSEAEPGTYTYMIKAKNERDQIVNDAITVTVVEHATTGTFNFITAALDGEAWDAGINTYVDSEIFVWGDEVTGLAIDGTPFASFTVPSDELLAAEYTSEGYITDRDHFYFNSRLPSCSGPHCTFTETVNGSAWTTSCDLILSDYHYACELTNDEGYHIMFDFRAEGDPAGDNTIRRYNLIYPASAPIVNFGELDASFVEGGDFIVSLDDYLYDEDTEPSAITWSVEGDTDLAVSIDPDSPHDAIISQRDPAWIGNQMLRFIAEDPEGNTGSDYLTVRVLNSDNNPPVIVSKTPEADSVNVGEGSTRLFSVDATDPDYDILTLTWRKGADVVATDSFTYLYEDTDGSPYPLTVIVSDGTEEAAAAWDINIVTPEGDLEGTVTDSETELALEEVTVDLFEEGGTPAGSTSTDGSGHYEFLSVHEGTYYMLFIKEGYEDELVESIEILPGETTIQDAQMTGLPSTIGTLQGHVEDSATSADLDGVLVEATPEAGGEANSTTTDGSGDYSMDLREGTYTIKFTKLGYEALEFTGVAITPESLVTQDAALVESPTIIGEITGIVTDDATEIPVSGALVKLLDGAVVVNSTLTDGSGYYSMEVVGDVYDVEVSKAGYRTETRPGITVTAGSVTTQDFSLTIWWDADWDYRKEIELDSSHALADYSLWLNISHEPGMNSDFSDLRFLSEDHSVELDHWIEEKIDGEWCAIWIEFDDVSTGSARQAWMYYGNVLASSNSDGTETFLVWDDFEDGTLDASQWVDVSTAPASVSEGSGYATLANDGAHRGYLRTLNTMPLNVEIMLEANVVNENGQFYTYMQWDGTHTGSFDRVTGNYIRVKDAFAGSQNLIAVVSDEVTEVGFPTSIIRPYDFNSYRINRYEGDYEYWLNDDMIISGYNETALPARYIGFSGRETIVSSRIDNVIIRNYASPEPAYTLGVEESRT